jgi:hypothetical protein
LTGRSKQTIISCDGRQVQNEHDESKYPQTKLNQGRRKEKIAMDIRFERVVRLATQS